MISYEVVAIYPGIMNIAIIGSGNIGTALATSLSRVGYPIFIGSREPARVHLSIFTGSAHIKAVTIEEAVLASDIIIIAVPLKAITAVVSALPDVRDKIILETTNAFGQAIPGYDNATLAIKSLTGCMQVARCFNTIGAENLKDLLFGDLKADAFTAGDSLAAKEMARRLATDIGFGECYDLGDDSALQELENIAQLWGALAYKGKLGRRVGMKILI